MSQQMEWLAEDTRASISQLLSYRPQTRPLAPEIFHDNISKFLSRGLVTRPHEFAWEITSHCNLRCRHCFVRDANALSIGQELDTKSCFSIIDQLSDLGVYLVIFSGGEPFLRDDFLDIVAYAKNRGFAIVIHTNALVLTDSLIDRLNRALHPEMDLLQVSLDGFTRETHEALRGKKTFDRTLSAVRALSQTDIMLRVNFTPTNSNILELPDCYSLCCELGVDQFSVSDFLELRHGDSMAPQENLLFKALAETVRRAASASTAFVYQMDAKFLYQRGIGIEGQELAVKGPARLTRVKCSASFRSMSMRCDGRVFLCIPASYCELPAFCLGNARTERLSDIWANRVNNIIYNGREASSLSCYADGCRHFEECHGGCIAKAYYYTQSTGAPDPRCRLARTHAPIQSDRLFPLRVPGDSTAE